MSHKNFPLLWKVYDHIVAHPKEWYQPAWAKRFQTETDCRTAYCFAGITCILGSNSEPDFSVFNMFNNTTEYLTNGRRISNYARDLLGLTRDEVELLFDGFNTLEKIHSLISHWERWDQIDNVSGR